MKNIVFLSRFYKPHIGGVEKHARELAKRLVKKGHKVTVVTTLYDNKLSRKEIVDGVQVIRFKQPNIRFIGLLKTWVWMFNNRKILLNSDILHIHDVFIWYLPLKLLFPSKKIFITFHGWEGVFPIPLINKLQKKLAYRLTEKNICIGRYVETHYGIKADVISYGATVTPKSEKKKDGNKITYIGRLAQDTGLPVFLEALEGITGLTVEFCGDGPLADKCKKYGTVHGFVDPEPYLEKSKYVFAGGYLSILESFANKCIVFCAYDNELKKDYYLDTPFSSWIKTCSSSGELGNAIKSSVSRSNKRKKLKFSYNWVSKQTWPKLLRKYELLWGTAGTR
jgi:glycosyltransferase involved in cell wall biosynthesis